MLASVRGEVWETIKWFVLAILAGMIIVTFATQAAVSAAPPDQPATVYIVSHWSGIFRAAEYPGAPPYVEVGSHVEPGTIVGKIQDVMVGQPTGAITVPAGVTGTISRVLVSNGEMVMVGQPLFEVIPSESITQF